MDYSLAGLSERLSDRMRRMRELVAARRTAFSSSDIPAIDEKMEEVCREMAEDIEAGRKRTDPISKRIVSMMQLTLEEMCEQRDNARRGL